MARKFGIVTNLTGLQAGIVVNSLTYCASPPAWTTFY